MDNSSEFTLSGVLHLPPLPGSPMANGCFDSVLEHALRDAESLVNGGIRSCVIENIGDAPFERGATEPHVGSMLAVIGRAVHTRFGDSLSVGINVLRNDARSAMGAAVACGADFIRVNVLVGAAWTDQGLIQGDAAGLTRYRKSLCGAGAGPKIMADVKVKHAVPAGETDIALLAKEAAQRGGADGLIVTGPRTGSPVDFEDLKMVREAAPNIPLWVGSGVTSATVGGLRSLSNGAIVGTWLHRDGDLSAPIDEDRVHLLVEAARS
jgi:membrane complex biogenesis BtpA family protein